MLVFPSNGEENMILIGVKQELQLERNQWKIINKDPKLVEYIGDTDRQDFKEKRVKDTINDYENDYKNLKKDVENPQGENFILISFSDDILKIKFDWTENEEPKKALFFFLRKEKEKKTRLRSIEKQIEEKKKELEELEQEKKKTIDKIKKQKENQREVFKARIPNDQNRPFKLVKFDNTNDMGIRGICLIENNKIVTVSIDGTMKVFISSEENGLVCKMTTLAHCRAINHICSLKNGYVATASSDKSVKIWNIKEQKKQNEQGAQEKVLVVELVAALYGHKGWIFKVIQLSDGTIATCSFDKTIKLWNHINYELIEDIEYGAFVFSVNELRYRKYLVAGGEDRKIMFWWKKKENNKFEKIATLSDTFCSNRNSIMEISNERIIVGGEDEIYVVSVSMFQVVTKFSLPVGCISCFLRIKGREILLGCKNFFIQINEETLVITKQMEDKTLINVIAFQRLGENSFLTASTDNILREWQYNPT